MKIRQKKIFEKKNVGEFWEKNLKIFEKMVKEIHLFIKFFEKIAKEIHGVSYTLFPKIKKIVKKGLKKKVIVKKLQKSQKSLKKRVKMMVSNSTAEWH